MVAERNDLWGPSWYSIGFFSIECLVFLFYSSVVCNCLTDWNQPAVSELHGMPVR